VKELKTAKETGNLSPENVRGNERKSDLGNEIVRGKDAMAENEENLVVGPENVKIRIVFFLRVKIPNRMKNQTKKDLVVLQTASIANEMHKKDVLSMYCISCIFQIQYYVLYILYVHIYNEFKCVLFTLMYHSYIHIIIYILYIIII
jgi:hypothetical protein